MDDLPLLERRGVRRIFGWIRVPDPTTFGRWLRRAGERMLPRLDELLCRMGRHRWALAVGAPKKLTLMMDSTFVVRYGRSRPGRSGATTRRSGAVPAIIRSWRSSGSRGTAWVRLARGQRPHRQRG